MNLKSNFKEASEILRKEGPVYTARYIVRRITAKANGYPSIVILETSSACNIKCEFCWVRNLDSASKRGNMDFALFRKAIDDISAFATGIELQWRGEAMVNKDLSGMVAYASKKGIFTSLSTNATLLDPESADRLLDAGLGKIVLALDGVTKATYESIRKGANYETVLANIKNLVRRKRERRLKKPYVKVQFIVTKKNMGEIKDFTRLMREIRPDAAYLKSLYIDRSGNDTAYLEKIENEYFVNLEGLPSRYTASSGGMSLKETEKNAAGRCPQYSRYPVIAHNGDILPCCFDVYARHKFGNIADRPFKDIWKDKRYVNFRKNVMEKRALPMCKNCLPLDKDINLKYLEL